MPKIISYIRIKRLNHLWKKSWKNDDKNSQYLKKNSELKFSAKRERCFIFGNGPSLKELDFSLFANEDVFTVNQISRNENFRKLKPKYHFWADPMFFYEKDGRPTISNDMFEHMQLIYKDNESIVLFAVSNPNNAVCKLIEKEHKIFYYKNFGELNRYLDAECDISHPSPSFYNVLQYAIYTAIFLGYKEIYLLGSEQSNLISILTTIFDSDNNKLEYGYNINLKEKQRLKEQYAKVDISVWLKEHALMFEDFKKLNDFAKSKGIKIVNCTPHSLITSIIKEDINNVLKNE